MAELTCKLDRYCSMEWKAILSSYSIDKSEGVKNGIVPVDATLHSRTCITALHFEILRNNSDAESFQHCFCPTYKRYMLSKFDLHPHFTVYVELEICTSTIRNEELSSLLQC